MALTKAQVREILSSAGVTAEHMSDAVDRIMDGHVTSINALREERDSYKADAEKLPAVQKELDEVKSKGDPDWQKKYEDEHTAFEQYTDQVKNDEQNRTKADLYREILTKVGVDPKRVSAIMRVTDLSKVSVKDGKIEDEAKLTDTIKTEWSEFIAKSGSKGATPENPPGGGGAPTKTKDEIMSIKDPEERQKAIAENISLFVKSTGKDD